MSEDKGMNMTEGSTRMLTISANSARERNNNNHEPELRRKNEMERNYFTGSTTDDNLVLLRSDQFGFVRGRRISRSGNGPMVAEGGGSRGGTGAAQRGGRGKEDLQWKNLQWIAVRIGLGSALGSGSGTRMMTSSGTLTSSAEHLIATHPRIPAADAFL